MTTKSHPKPSAQSRTRIWRLRALKRLLAVAQRLSPRLSGRLAARLWFMPGAHARKLRPHPVFTEAREIRFALHGKDIVAYHWGSGPRVLLMHGWGGNSSQLAQFVRPLRKTGFEIVALDAPAHGRSSGRATTVFEIADAIAWLADHQGPFFAAITHSFGAMSVTLAMRQGVALERLVLISPPAHAEGLVTKFADRLSLGQPTVDALRRHIERRSKPEVWGWLALDRLPTPPAIPTLVIHDRDDADVPAAEGRSLADHWPQARLMETQGLGHRLILRDREVIAAALRALGEAS